MKKIFCAIMIILAASGLSGCTFLKVDLADEAQPFQEQVLSGEGRDKILVIDLSGIITSDERETGIMGRKRAGILSRVREELDRVRTDHAVKAVVLRINSPGGGVTASDTLYHEIVQFKRDTGVKIIAHIMDTGASGAYYAALAADRILAQPTSVTGSIGVIMLHVDATGLMQKIGLQTLEISSGEHKGMGSPFRAMSPEERKMFQGVIDSIYTRFITLVSEGRKLPLETVRKLADGRILTSQEAKDGGLIDGIGYLDDALEAAKKEAGLSRARIVTYFRPGDYRPNIYSLNLVNIDLGEMMEPGVKFMYIWWP